MKNNNRILTYTLLFSVVGIWSYIIYNFVGLEEIPDENLDQFSSLGTLTAYTMPNDSFELRVDYRDPFIGRVPNEIVKRTKKIKKKTANKPKNEILPKIKPAVVWPNVKYLGLMTSVHHIGYIKLNGREQMVKKDEVISGVTISAIEPNYLILKSGLEERKIFLE